MLLKMYSLIYIIKWYYHYIQAIWKHIKKYINQKDRKKEIIELDLNLKRLPFINPNNIPKLFKITKKKFTVSIYNEFFKYFHRTWNPK